MNIVIQHHPETRCFLAQPEPGLQCRLDYERHGEQLIITHTGVPAQLRGLGLAGQLVEAALRWLAPMPLQLVPGCSFVRHFLDRQPRWQRLLTPAAAQRVLNTWFGVPGSDEDGQVQTRWFRKDPAFDAQLREQFLPLIEQALSGGLRDWDHSPWGALARVLLLDQFTRNVFRDTPRAFEGDPLALRAALDLLPRAAEPLSTLEHWFVLMPLEHAEDLAMQQKCVALFEDLVKQDARLKEALDYAERHRDVIARFGRFPHRNEVLGRTSTAEEMEFLRQPGSRF